MDFTPYIAPAVTIIIAVVGGYFAVTNAITKVMQEMRVDVARIEQKVDDLKEDVEKHNGVVEKVAINTRDIKTAFIKIDELKERDDKIEARIEKLHE